MSKSLPKSFVFTNGKVKALPYPAAGSQYIEFYDEGCPGLRARVQPQRAGKTKAQRIAWYFRRTVLDATTGKTKRPLLKCPDGNLSDVELGDARKWAERQRGLDAMGTMAKSPVIYTQTKRNDAMTVAEGMQRYCEARLKGEYDSTKVTTSSVKKYYAVMEHWLGNLGNLDLREVTPEMADQHLLWLRQDKCSSMVLKERYNCLKRMFEMARTKWHVLNRGTVNPFDQEPLGDPHVKQTVWTLHDFWRLWNFWPENDQAQKRSLLRGGLKGNVNKNGHPWWQVYHDLCSAAKLLMLTGARRNEICHMTWGEYQTEYNPKMNEERMCIKVDATHRTVKEMKIKRPFIICLSQPAWHIIEWHKKEFFNGDVSQHQQSPIFPTLYNTSLNQFLRTKVGGKNGARRFERSPHDIRRTVATCLHAIGCDPHIVAAILGHSAESRGSAAMKHYNMYTYFPEKQRWLDVWGKLLQDTMDQYDPVNNTQYQIGVHPKAEGSMEKNINATLQRLRNLNEPEERRFLPGHD